MSILDIIGRIFKSFFHIPKRSATSFMLEGTYGILSLLVAGGIEHPAVDACFQADARLFDRRRVAARTS